MFKTLKNNYDKGVVALLCFAPVLALAQAADPFDAALSSATTKVQTYAAALVVLSSIAVGFMIAIKYIKKIVRAA